MRTRWAWVGMAMGLAIGALSWLVTTDKTRVTHCNQERLRFLGTQPFDRKGWDSKQAAAREMISKIAESALTEQWDLSTIEARLGASNFYNLDGGTRSYKILAGTLQETVLEIRPSNPGTVEVFVDPMPRGEWSMRADLWPGVCLW